MPIVMPTPEEASQMDWWHRDKVIRSARALLRGYGAIAVPAEPRAWRASPEVRAARKAARAEELRAWGEDVRAEARRINGEAS